ncbi:MAG: hypothetical protein KKA45_03910 [Alphaproteobacteria bacterium]|nr:hypothetical protein [Alphaproteobacteria bacterium]
MRKSKQPVVKSQRRSCGGAVAHVALALLSALMLLAAPLCVAQAQSADCETMTMPIEVGDHQDQGGPISKLDCAVGCRVVPPLGPQVIAPVRVAYEVHFVTDLRTPEGVVVDPVVPPPRWAV